MGEIPHVRVGCALSYIVLVRFIPSPECAGELPVAYFSNISISLISLENKM